MFLLVKPRETFDTGPSKFLKDGIERRDKLDTRGFTNEIDFLFLLVKPRVLNLSRRSILVLVLANFSRMVSNVVISWVLAVLLMKLSFCFHW